MGLIQYTPVGASEVQLVAHDKVLSIYEGKNSEVFIRFKTQAKANGKVVQIQEILDDIFDQQVSVGMNLKMILVTDAKTGNRMILITKWLKQIVNEGTGARVTFLRGLHDSINTTENLNDIFAYQGGGGSVDLNMLFVSRVSDNEEFILFDHQIKKILPYPVTSPTGSEIQFDPPRDPMLVNETPLSLWSDQPQ